MELMHLIWDLDGTLIDSSEDIITCIEQAIALAKIPKALQNHEIQIGPPLDIMIQNAFPTISEHDLQDIINRYRQLYDNSSFMNTKTFDGIQDIIALPSIKNYIVTNKHPIPTKRILKKLKWESYFETIRTPYATGINQMVKNKSVLIQEIIEEYKLPIQHCFYIGDMPTDIKAGNDNHINTIAVTWGTATTQALRTSNPNYLIDSTASLLQLFKNKII